MPTVGSTYVNILGNENSFWSLSLVLLASPTEIRWKCSHRVSFRIPFLFLFYNTRAPN